MAELADALDLGSSALGRGSSSLPRRTKDIGNENQVFGPGFFLLGKFSCHCGSQSCCLRSAHLFMLAQRCAPPTSLTSRVVCGGSHLSTLALPCSHLRLNPPVHAGAALAPCLPALRRSRQPPRRSASQPLFHHTVSKRPDHQLHAIMCSRLCHGGR